MSKISEIVKVRGGCANFVQLRSALREEEENAGRMAMYRPTKAHRNALERICRGLYMPNDKKFYLLSGSYGTGNARSHLREAPKGASLSMNVRCGALISRTAKAAGAGPLAQGETGTVTRACDALRNWKGTLGTDGRYAPGQPPVTG